ncbi:MAG: hypothetical protein HC842_05115 [Cytophagales bacterium]|nr:hypothetical protein [Cytophagales bacterium]
MDTLRLSSAASYSLNAAVYIQYQVLPKLAIGFNIDALGLGFGAEQDAQFINNSASPAIGSAERAAPTASNLLLVGNNDIGQLKSEFYVAYRLSDRLSVRAGMDYTFSEYTATRTLAQDNDRFRFKAGMGFLAISFQPF